MELLDITDMAKIYKTTDKGIYTRRSRSPESLPPSFKIGERVLWNKETVDAWFEEQERIQNEG